MDAKLAIRTAIIRTPLCGCGDTDKMWEIVRDALGRADSDSQGIGDYRTAMPEHDLSETAVEFVAQVLSETRLLEHGSAVYGSWLTAPGKLLLLFLRKYGCDSDEWPDWARGSDTAETFAMSPEQWREFYRSNRNDITPESVP